VEASSLVERERMEDSTYLSEQEKDPGTINRPLKAVPAQFIASAEINKAVCHFLAMGMHPISTVDEARFCSLMFKLNPRYNCLSRKHFSEKELPQLYANVRDTKIKPQLDRISYFLLQLTFAQVHRTRHHTILTSV